MSQKDRTAFEQFVAELENSVRIVPAPHTVQPPVTATDASATNPAPAAQPMTAKSPNAPQSTAIGEATAEYKTALRNIAVHAGVKRVDVDNPVNATAEIVSGINKIVDSTNNTVNDSNRVIDGIRSLAKVVYDDQQREVTPENAVTELGYIQKNVDYLKGKNRKLAEKNEKMNLRLFGNCIRDDENEFGVEDLLKEAESENASLKKRFCIAAISAAVCFAAFLIAVSILLTNGQVAADAAAPASTGISGTVLEDLEDLSKADTNASSESDSAVDASPDEPPTGLPFEVSFSEEQTNYIARIDATGIPIEGLSDEAIAAALGSTDDQYGFYLLDANLGGASVEKALSLFNEYFDSDGKLGDPAILPNRWIRDSNGGLALEEPVVILPLPNADGIFPIGDEATNYAKTGPCVCYSPSRGLFVAELYSTK